MMKTITKTLLLLAIAIVLTSCPNGQQTKTDNGTVQQPEEQAFQYVEPTGNIAQIIWEKLSVENPTIKAFLEKAKGYESMRETKPEPQYQSETRMLYYHTGYEFDGAIDEFVFYQMQCYQMKDQSWIAIVFSNCYNDYGDPEDSELRCFHYKNGELLNDNPEIGLPVECPHSLLDHKKDYFPWRECTFHFDELGFEMIPEKMWPMRYDWTGEKFEINPNSQEIANVFHQDAIEHYDFSTNSNKLNYYSWLKADKNYLITNTETGDQVLQLEFEGDKLSAINFISPKIGLDFGDEWVRHYYTYYYNPSSPIALGQPIKNVFANNKSKDIYDEITESKKDGLYTLTQHICVDKNNHKDIYAEYQAKDINSNIERIRIFGQPLAITLESELAGNDRIAEETKQVWAMINAGDAVTKNVPGTFKKFWNVDKNGFAAIFREEYDNGDYAEWKMTYTVVKANDGSRIAFVRKNGYNSRASEITPEWEQYICQNGQVRQVEPRIPKPQLTDIPAYNLGDTSVAIEGEDSSIEFECAGLFRFHAHSNNYSGFGDPWPDADWPYYTVTFTWNGEEFVPEAFDYEEFFRYHEKNEKGQYEYIGDFEEDYEEDYEGE